MRGDLMLIQPGRIFARTVDEAISAIRDKYGDGRLSIRHAHVQPRKGMVWYEYYIVLGGEPT